MNIDFYKIHILKNDFILADLRNITDSIKLMSKIAESICSRKTGVGGSGIIFVTESDNNCITIFTFAPDGSFYDFTCDSSITASRFIFDQIPVDSKKFYLVNNNKNISVQILDSMTFRIFAGNPDFNEGTTDNIIIDSYSYIYTKVTMGKTGLVFFPEKKSNEQLKDLNSKILKSGSLYNTVPLFVYPSSKNSITVRTWTAQKHPDCCLSGALASVAAGLNGYENEIIASYNNMPVFCEWDRNSNEVFITANPVYSFTGNYFFDEGSI